MIGAAGSSSVGRTLACPLQPRLLASSIPAQANRSSVSRPLQQCCSCSCTTALCSSITSPSSRCGGSPQQRQQLWRHRWRQRRATLQPLVVQAEPEEVDLEFDGEWRDPAPLRYEEGGYTPFEYIEFSDILLKHEISIFVAVPVDMAFDSWADRLNWLYWFDEFIDEMGFHEEDPSLVSMYLWYRWAMTPKLELYCTLKRTEELRNKHILEEPVEGMPFVSAVLFQPLTAGEEEAEDVQERLEDYEEYEDWDGTGTLVTLRVQYLLPKVLAEFAGQVAVYADVDKKLEAAMLSMRDFVETVDLASLEDAREEEAELLREGFEEQRAAIAAAAVAAEEAAATNTVVRSDGCEETGSEADAATDWEPHRAVAAGAAAADPRNLQAGPDWSSWDSRDSALLEGGQ